MTEITKIKITKKGRYALFCGEDFLFSLDEATFTDNHIDKGMLLSDEDIEELRKQSDYHKALDRAFLILGVRDHSVFELKNKLCRDFDEETAVAAVERIEELGYLDDRAFAERYAAELAGKNRSMSEIRSRLAEKRVSREIIDEVSGGIDSDDRESIRQTIEKKYLRKLQADGGRNKVYAALIRRGFRSGDISAVLREYNIAEEDYYGQE